MDKYQKAIDVLTNTEDPACAEFADAISLAIETLQEAAQKAQNKPLTYEEAVAIAETESVHILLHNGNTKTLPAIIHEDGTVDGGNVNTELVVLWNTAGFTLPLTDINKRFTLYRYPMDITDKRETVDANPSTKLYWVSAIVQNVFNKKPFLLAMSEGELNLEKAKDIISRIKENNTVLSVWIDTFNEKNIKQTVYHECYIDAFGYISPSVEG